MISFVLWTPLQVNLYLILSYLRHCYPLLGVIESCVTLVEKIFSVSNCHFTVVLHRNFEVLERGVGEWVWTQQE